MLVNDERDAIRRHKARAILMREDPDWRAVKRARRLLRDADRVNRVARAEAMKAAWKGVAAGMSNLAAAYRRAAEQIGAMTAVMPSFRIPMLPPGDELRVVAVKGASRAGKTAAMEAAARDLDPYTIRPIAIVPTVRREPSYRHDVLAFRVSNIDWNSPEAQRALRLAADRERHWRDAFATNALLGEPYGATGRCRHGVWLYGDSCATCAREDRDEAGSPDPKRDD